ncbi:MAG: Deoxyguanosinetriphosphate triphosphohydrolase [Candidatus Accumulibacter regalis]|jgi:dGTPase|uniref:Deoxyguanosinetriphosphate triphosphohydrolase-like protein n=1 Tax=Accumulibacter regalis TaxID=522306 RepID=A0A011Q952_ACCRE|nr:MULTISPECIES: deoxyguanosinetriphosphate triphosphohydrolase [unclassified Candidatus Accumulibacter]EXI85762.1 MAG: Deoxyguanosinetriphosphate triphosphohydrolase [Candidatus Accumulibacter regalis]MBL8369641.1 deoxyguanosinetriphosphate triphosphohydrolase [Accumulibacter sp.]HRE71999.1 deoxyguanosinetriphosphate triphosphohydrolase [Accumulibacter sp.]HRE85633.1 deoxyguanosinetriphosphate triphosphohydrolase [Accumulibacter sp.]HRI90590.1 deoxyguanosinetriphosphate triphosphohydrolase [A
MPELVAYAVSAENSRGRRYPDTEPLHRSEFQRDRDRIVHSTAFRRLEYKTQVFVNHEGDLFRTRLTHSLEVAQIARAIARSLALNEDLVEAISLAHDLGHTPFGHAGQEALNECMRDHGGFEHNLQSLRIVDTLEERYAAFDGLNLCFETREGIVKHCSLENARQLGEVGERFLVRRQPSLEAQICNLADEIAYNHHDVDDGLRSGLIRVEQLEELRLFARHVADVRRLHAAVGGRRLIHETIRRMINAQVCDLIETTAAKIRQHAPRDLAEARSGPALVAFSDESFQAQRQMKHFLRTQLYQHYQVLRMASKARRIVSDLFAAFSSDPRMLPPQYQLAGEGDQARQVADYIAGMTDRYAIKEHRRLFAVGEG